MGYHVKQTPVRLALWTQQWGYASLLWLSVACLALAAYFYWLITDGLWSLCEGMCHAESAGARCGQARTHAYLFFPTLLLCLTRVKMQVKRRFALRGFWPAALSAWWTLSFSPHACWQPHRQRSTPGRAPSQSSAGAAACVLGAFAGAFMRLTRRASCVTTTRRRRAGRSSCICRRWTSVFACPLPRARAASKVASR